MIRLSLFSGAAARNLRCRQPFTHLSGKAWFCGILPPFDTKIHGGLHGEGVKGCCRSAHEHHLQTTSHTLAPLRARHEPRVPVGWRIGGDGTGRAHPSLPVGCRIQRPFSKEPHPRRASRHPHPGSEVLRGQKELSDAPSIPFEASNNRRVQGLPQGPF